MSLKSKGFVVHIVKGQELLLLPQKAIFWKDKNCLFVSDVHLGKIEHFRKNGIPLPEEASLDNYERLSSLINQFLPKTVIFLGDLFHSEKNSDWNRFVGFVSHFCQVNFVLVKGNHDIFDHGVLTHVLTELHEESLVIGPFLLSHYPTESNNKYNICGHVHPSVKIKGPARQSISLPCFYFYKDRGILPAFGVFTGTHSKVPSQEDQVYVIAEDQVIKFEQ